MTGALSVSNKLPWINIQRVITIYYPDTKGFPLHVTIPLHHFNSGTQARVKGSEPQQIITKYWCAADKNLLKFIRKRLNLISQIRNFITRLATNWTFNQ